MTKVSSHLLDHMLKPHTAQPELTDEAYLTMLWQGIQFQSEGQFEAAEQQYATVLSHRPEDYQTLTLLASLHLHLMRLEECLQYAGRSLAVNAMQPDLCNIVGDAHYFLARYEDAFKAYSLALRLRPDDAKAYFDAANSLKLLGRSQEALVHYQQAIALNPDYVEAHHNLGVVFRDGRQLQQALACFGRAIELFPEYVEAYVNCGSTLADLGKYDFALAHYDYALGLQPEHINGLNGRGVALQNLKQLDAALASFDQVLALKPDFPDAYLNRGNTLLALGRHEEALQDYAQALTLTPTNSRIYSNRGNLHLDLGHYEEALADYDRAIDLDARNATALWNKALIKIVQGEYLEGWQLYEHGWEAEGPPRGHRKQCPQPLWLGETSLAGKRILLTAEQGFGDAIQFARYALEVAKLQPSEIILEAPKPLMALFRTLHPEFKVIERGSAYEAFDCYCPYMSLPLAFKTTIDSVPAQIPYLFADPSRRSKFQLGERHRPRIGLVWSGSISHARDHKRSLPLELLQPLLALPLEFHCLQKDIRPVDAALLNQLPIRQHQAGLGDFSDTAALIDAMDIVISVDTSVAHLAGALGKSGWILLPKVPDYRWLLEREDSPWYPTARLFRQQEAGNWDNVIAALVAALTQLA